MTEIKLVISDLQVPFHDKRAVDLVAQVVADYDIETYCVGDVLDSTQISQWARGNALEYLGTLANDRDEAVKVMNLLNIKHLSRSNHDDRIEKYVSQHAPGLKGLPELRIEEFLRLNENGIQFYRKPHAIAPGWVLLHGDESGYSRASGGTALGLARKIGKSVVCGHTHKLGLQHEHPTVGGRIQRDIWGFEVGNLMDMNGASYLKAGIANWNQGIGALVVDGNTVFPVPIPIKNRKLYWDGHIYRA